jgi:hypothetical protein
LLRQIISQIDLGAAVGPAEASGLLLGPDPQSDDVLIEETIPLGNEQSLLRSPAKLVAGIESVQPKLAEAVRNRSHTIVGLYRIVSPRQDEGFESSLEFLADGRRQDPSLSSLRCAFEFVPLSVSETSLRVLMRQGGRWAQAPELTLRSGPPIPALRRKAAVMKPTDFSPQRLVRKAARVLEDILSTYRLFVEGAVVTLLLLLLIVNAFVVSSVRRIQRDMINVQALTAQIRELAADVSELQSPTLPRVPPAGPESNRRQANAHVAPKQVSAPPAAKRNLMIPAKPLIVRPSEVFQFNVKGNPTPEVAWSSEGPGSIDPVYGLYRAPNQFIGEATVRVTASSWAGSQSVTFTLRGARREEK